MLTWTKQHDEKLMRLWSSGLSASRIAGEMGAGFTRNMVIGRIMRMRTRSAQIKTACERREAERIEKHKQMKERIKREKEERIQAEIEARIAREKQRDRLKKRPRHPITVPLPERAPAVMLATSTVASGAAAAVLALNSKTCRWPIGDVQSPDFRFCLAPTHEHRYCPQHRAKSRAVVLDKKAFNGVAGRGGAR